MFARAIRQHTACSRVAAAATSRACQPRVASASASGLTTTLRSFTTSPNRRQPTTDHPAPSPSTSTRLLPRKLMIPIDSELSLPAAETIPETPIAVLRSVAAARKWASETSFGSTTSTNDDQGIALIPTMGALHEGHLRLIREAARRGHDKIAVSIYVNPAQFGVAEDLDSYPKTWVSDCAVLKSLYEELSSQSSHPLQMAVFAPTTGDMYPSGFPGQEVDSKGSFVTITPVGEVLEGQSRPTFFRGVATVCMKLFNIVQPSRVFFGQKDVQQTVVIRKMVRDFHLPMDVVIVPTVRAEEGDGLALSSRNVYLGARRRKAAPVLYRALKAAEKTYVDGSLDAGEILPAALKVILDTMQEQRDLPPKDGVLFKLEYISLADPDTMEEIDLVDPSRGAILSGAIRMLPVYDPQPGEDLGAYDGPSVRLIDNIILAPKA
ncbi:Pantothenate synthetase [Cytospora mali]|uniref:Pantoate--beta-alanine ligase n=1 Tax=Cytospora mali TaxID=578113 RepID=A0A194USF4_CYTMA|nr:Pantothenate synthetase [Valsa mali var. pyri (nom. inval.)]